MENNNKMKLYSVQFSKGSRRVYQSGLDLKAGDHVVAERRHGFECGIVIGEAEKLPDYVDPATLKEIKCTFEGSPEEQKAAKIAEARRLAEELNSAISGMGWEFYAKLAALVDKDAEVTYQQLLSLKAELGDDFPEVCICPGCCDGSEDEDDKDDEAENPGDNGDGGMAFSSVSFGVAVPF